jgi:hypothetical protein
MLKTSSYKKFFYQEINRLFSRLNLYVYEYLYHIGASKAAQGFCADVSEMLFFLLIKILFLEISR